MESKPLKIEQMMINTVHKQILTATINNHQTAGQNMLLVATVCQGTRCKLDKAGYLHTFYHEANLTLQPEGSGETQELRESLVPVWIPTNKFDSPCDALQINH